MAPDTMRVVELQGFGGPEVLGVAERAIPQIAPGEVLIRVAAAGFNRADVSQREGQYPPPPGESDLPGLECSGVVVATGPSSLGPQPMASARLEQRRTRVISRRMRTPSSRFQNKQWGQ